jgi:hypothetical protein
MRSLRLFRSPAPAASAKSAELDGDGGLLAFASETTPTVAAPVPAAALAVTETPAARLTRARIVVPLLAALVLLQAGPTFFWVRDRYLSAAPAATAAANVPPPAPFLAAAPCEPPVPDQPAALEASAAGGATTAAAPPRPPALVAGLLSVETPVPMRVYARGRLVGTTEAETIMLPVGTHELTLENTNVGYQARRTVTVQAGRTSTVRLEPPAGSMNVNAVPWAEILVDGRRVGETPLAHVPVPIGSHEVVFRHPELGERRASVLVTLKGPARVSMDLRAK